MRLKSATLQPRTRNFNPRTPVGCDSERHEPDSGVPISIHAPQWGATCGRTCRWSPDRHFNPRTPVGCDIKPIGRYLIRFLNFNPRTPVGCDRSGLRGRGGFVEISIHAPQWGATTVDATITPILRFQSTHPSGVRPTATRTAIRVCNFNPRTPVGCDDPSRRSRRDQGYFNPRTPVGCDAREVAGAVHELISIHAPQWGATCRSFPRSRRQSISIHAPQWGATIFAHILPTLFRISIHAPQWGATCGRFSTRFTVVFQSTHPSGVRHSLCHPVLPLLGISIHAPQWGATDAAREPFTLSHISIHAPQWGATWRGTRRPSFWDDFNPRTPVGCDAVCVITMATDLFQSTHPSGVRRADGQGRGRPLQISIHAPQWGATGSGSCDCCCWLFQSTHPSGVRLGDGGETWRHRSHFNPRTPVGCDRPTGTSRRTPPYFNPRTPVGCDDNHLHREIRSRRFQSTHPSGVRPTPAGCTVKHYQISIHAPQWGATGLLFAITCDTPYFNPRTPVGCDHPVSAGQVHSAISIHAPQWGATEYRNAIINVDMISIHAPQWGATES